MNRFERCDYLPTPRQISVECALIRDGWSPTERRRRRVGRLWPEEHGWLPPQIWTANCLGRVRGVVEASV